MLPPQIVLPLSPALTIGSSFPDVWLHGLVTVLGTEVALGRQQELNVLLGGMEGGGKLVGGHCR